MKIVESQILTEARQIHEGQETWRKLLDTESRRRGFVNFPAQLYNDGEALANYQLSGDTSEATIFHSSLFLTATFVTTLPKMLTTFLCQRTKNC